MKNKIYQSIAQKNQAIFNFEKTGNREWQINHRQSIFDLMKTAPSGSGIDCGIKIDLAECTENKLVFRCEFHHMNENGYYDGWTSHKIIVTPDLANGFNLRITGKNRNEIKGYLHEVYSIWFNEEAAL